MDSRNRRDGAALEQLGYYNPRAKADKGEKLVSLDVEATRAWLGKGAQPTETVLSLLRKAQVFDVQPVSN